MVALLLLLLLLEVLFFSRVFSIFFFFSLCSIQKRERPHNKRSFTTHSKRGFSSPTYYIFSLVSLITRRRRRHFARSKKKKKKTTTLSLFLFLCCFGRRTERTAFDFLKSPFFEDTSSSSYTELCNHQSQISPSSWGKRRRRRTACGRKKPACRISKSWTTRRKRSTS